jgi:hypothetical protein
MRGRLYGRALRFTGALKDSAQFVEWAGRRRRYSECSGPVRPSPETKFMHSPIYVVAGSNYGRRRLSRGDSGDPARMGSGDRATSGSAGSVAIS